MRSCHLLVKITLYLPSVVKISSVLLRYVCEGNATLVPPTVVPTPSRTVVPPTVVPPDCGPSRSGQCSPHKLSRGDYCRENNGSSPPSKFRSSRGGTTVRIFTTVVPQVPDSSPPPITGGGDHCRYETGQWSPHTFLGGT